MSRVLLVGQGPLPSPGARETGFAQLRTQHFLDALRGAGHEVETLLIEQDREPGLLERGQALARRAEVLVSAGPYRPGETAAAIAGDLPLWADLPGDPFAELQAVSMAPGGRVDDARIDAARAATLPVLERADRISVVSPAQRLAALGQLGLLGRLVGEPPVEVLPIAFSFPFPQAPPRPRSPGDPLVVALCGGFNAWLDEETLAAGLEQALAREPRLSVICTGGGIPGHHEAGWQRFSAWAARSPSRDRLRILGRVPQEELAQVLRDAHLGLFLDRRGPEPELGSRTRVLLFGWLGLEIMGTGSTGLMQDLIARDLAIEVPAGSPEALAEALLRRVDAVDGAERARAAAHHLIEIYDPARIAGPLLRWVGSPSRHPARPRGERELAIRLADREAELAAITSSPTWRALSKIHLLGRRLFRG